MDPDRVIAVIDDEVGVREGTANLLRSAGYRAESFASAEEFLQSSRLHSAACLLLDMGLPGMNGLQLQQQLGRLGVQTGVIFMTASDDSSGVLRRQAMQAGALAFLHKPFREQELLNAVKSAIGS